MQSAHGLDASATGQGGQAGVMDSRQPPDFGATLGVQPPTRVPSASASASAAAPKPSAAPSVPRSPHQVRPGGKSPAREPVIMGGGRAPARESGVSPHMDESE